MWFPRGELACCSRLKLPKLPSLLFFRPTGQLVRPAAPALAWTGEVARMGEAARRITAAVGELLRSICMVRGGGEGESAEAGAGTVMMSRQRRQGQCRSSAGGDLSLSEGRGGGRSSAGDGLAAGWDTLCFQPLPVGSCTSNTGKLGVGALYAKAGGCGDAVCQGG